jgi:hypothetical protein
MGSRRSGHLHGTAASARLLEICPTKNLSKKRKKITYRTFTFLQPGNNEILT